MKKKQEFVIEIVIKAHFRTYNSVADVFNVRIQEELSKLFSIDSKHIEIRKTREGSVIVTIAINLDVIPSPFMDGTTKGLCYYPFPGKVKLKSGNKTLSLGGATTGAILGLYGGLWGALVGGTIGALASGFSGDSDVELEVGIGIWSDGTYRFVVKREK